LAIASAAGGTRETAFIDRGDEDLHSVDAIHGYTARSAWLLSSLRPIDFRAL
jgi:hypothetical protein